MCTNVDAPLASTAKSYMASFFEWMFVEPEKPTWTDRFLYPVKFFLVIIGVLALCTVVTALGAVIENGAYDLKNDPRISS